MDFSDVLDWLTCMLAICTLAYTGRQMFIQLFELKVRILIVEYDIYRRNYNLSDWVIRVYRLLSSNKMFFMLNYSDNGSVLYNMVEELFESGDCRVYSGSKLETVLLSLKHLVGFE